MKARCLCLQRRGGGVTLEVAAATQGCPSFLLRWLDRRPALLAQRGGTTMRAVVCKAIVNVDENINDQCYLQLHQRHTSTEYIRYADQLSSWFIIAAAAALSKEREKIESRWKLHK